METKDRALLPLLGEKFPELEVVTTHGVKKLPGDYQGKWFVLFSHPGDFTPVCTTEFAAFERRRKDFEDIGCELIGLSIDQVFSHIKWVEWIKEKLDVEIGFPVIADGLGTVAQTLGMLHPGKGSNTVRSVFIVDPNGVIRIILHYPQEVGRNIDEVLRAVKALQTSDKNKVAIPANWPNNEILGDKVIVPPPASEAAIAKRREEEKAGEVECKDWWFCYKKL
ncbi:MAG: peroxiredoxin [Firmicutes bacterium]|jgi:peroxiredoxin (alkyl hydroperoxide reductase subunit C)|nr:peroxiredoxin [Bacillota bacterium]